MSGATLPERPESGTCKCGGPVVALHACPYLSEVHNNEETLCDCCDECRRQCSDDI